MYKVTNKEPSRDTGYLEVTLEKPAKKSPEDSKPEDVDTGNVLA